MDGVAIHFVATATPWSHEEMSVVHARWIEFLCSHVAKTDRCPAITHSLCSTLSNMIGVTALFQGQHAHE